MATEKVLFFSKHKTFNYWIIDRK